MKSLRGVLAAAFIVGCASDARAASCESLTSLKLPSTTITQAKSESTYCRVAATLRPTSDSEIKMEIWMPVANWNGKYQAVGNGAFNGKFSRKWIVDFWKFYAPRARIKYNY